MKFVLDPKLAIDTDWICDLPLCQVRLSLNAAFPWIILIPRVTRAQKSILRANELSEPALASEFSEANKNSFLCSSIVEIIDLSIDNQLQLFKEMTLSSQIMKTLFEPTKLNVANLGNIVSQLHIHIIARFNTDLAWPQPVWNSGITKTYTEREKQDRVALLLAAFEEKS